MSDLENNWEEFLELYTLYRLLEPQPVASDVKQCPLCANLDVWCISLVLI